MTRIYKLKFEDPTLEGLEVKVRSMSIGEALEFAELAEKMGDSKDVAQVRPVLEKLAEKIASWNVEDDEGNPVEITVENLFALEMVTVMAVIEAWMEVVGGLSDPLSKNSSGGKTHEPVESPLAMVPMEAL